MTIMKIPRIKLTGIFSVRRLFDIISFVLLFTSWSCATKKCAMCDLDNTTIYNVEMNENSSKKYGKKNFMTYFAPVPVETVNKKVNVYLVDCEGKDAYNLKHGKELEKFVKENMLTVDSLDVKKITVTSDADIYPVSFTLKKLKELTNLNLCKRSRNNFKIEARAMFGFRSFEESSYQPLPGDIPLEKEVFGFGEGGTMITTGFEAAFLPAIFSIKDKHRFHLGAMTGYWPVDGGNFIPLSIHPRFTFNDINNPLFGNCNALYLFGDIGTAYDISSEFEKFWSNKFNASFWGLGAGADLWVTKGMDVSVDLGYRRMTLPLSSLGGNSEWAECADNHNIPYSDFPRRRTGQFFIRLGVTF